MFLYRSPIQDCTKFMSSDVQLKTPLRMTEVAFYFSALYGDLNLLH